MRKNKSTILCMTLALLISQLCVVSAGSSDGVGVNDAVPSVEKVVWKSAYTHKTLSPGSKFKLKAKCMPKSSPQIISYRSNKRSVAKVTESGVVTAVKKGTAIITATAKGTNIKAKYYIHVGKKVKKLKRMNAKSKITLYKGSKIKLKIKCLPQKAAYKKTGFTSSKKSVATVSKNGVVKAKKNGKTTITATALDQSGKKLKYRITVRTKVKKIKLSAAYKTCFIGKKLKIKCKFTPSSASNKGLKWKSSNKKVATVSKTGYVKGKKKGTVKITATSKENSKKKATYKVYVRGPLDPSKEAFTAHRGFSSKYPENTIQSFAAAGAQSFAAVETDIWENEEFYEEKPGDLRKADDLNGETDDPPQDFKTNPQFVIMHDETLKRMCGVNVKVSSLNEKNITEYKIINGNGNDKNIDYKIPVLEEYLEVLKDTDKRASIELKEEKLSEEAAEKLIDMIDAYEMGARTRISSFNKESLLVVQKALNGRKDIKLVRLIGARNKGNIDSEIDWCISNGMDSVSMSYKYLTQDYIKTIKNAGMMVTAWTVDDKNLAADLFRMGVDGVSTNSVLW